MTAPRSIATLRCMTTLLLLTVENLANDAEGNPDDEPPNDGPHGGGAAQVANEGEPVQDLRAPLCEGPKRGGPVLIGHVLRQVMPCRPLGSVCLGDLRSVDVIEPTEDGGFRVRHAHCQGSKSEVASHSVISVVRAERRHERVRNDRNRCGCHANEKQGLEKGHGRFRWAA